MRKLVLNIYEELPHGQGMKEIPNSLVQEVISELPITGVVRFSLSDGTKLMAAKHDNVKNETYDIYWG